MTALGRPAAVVFDMDGLLFDTEAHWHDALIALAAEKDLPQIDSAVARSTIGLSWDATCEMFGDLLPANHDPESFISAWKDRYAALAEARLEMKSGVIELLDHLQELDIPCAVATNTSRQIALNHLSHHGLIERFVAIVTAEDCVEGKPAPDPYLEAARRLGVPPAECIALEDSINGVLSAHRAGMTTVMVPDLIEPDETTAGLCAKVARTLHDVREMLARQDK